VSCTKSKGLPIDVIDREVFTKNLHIKILKVILHQRHSIGHC
jgi:hypothetical protein